MNLNLMSLVRPGDKIEMHYINSQNKDLLLETIVYDVLSDDELYVHNPLYEGKLYMIPMNAEITVFAKRIDIGVIAFRMVLLKREKQGNVYTIKCRLSSEIKKQQRRHFFRVKTYRDMDVYCMVDVQGHPVNYYIFDPDAVEEQQVNFKLDLLDISGGGVGARCKIDLPLGTYVYGFLPVINRRLEVHGVVVRSVPSSKYPGEYEIGIMFKDLDGESVRIITSYVFKAQQEARRKEMD